MEKTGRVRGQLRTAIHAALTCLLSLFLSSSFSSAEQAVTGECVILLHGLARTASSMEPLQLALAEQGYTVANIDYPSREKRIEELAGPVVDAGLAICREKDARRIHFVTHSMGGILVRYYLAGRSIPEIGRVVMLAPPNKGSRVVEEFRSLPGYSLLNGPAGYQLGKDELSVPLQLGPANFDVGVIAGDRTINLILSTAFEGANDGKVAVEDAKLAGMKDFLVVHTSHPFIMSNNEVIEQVRYFLVHGMFRHDR